MKYYPNRGNLEPETIWESMWLFTSSFVYRWKYKLGLNIVYWYKQSQEHPHWWYYPQNTPWYLRWLAKPYYYGKNGKYNPLYIRRWKKHAYNGGDLKGL